MIESVRASSSWIVVAGLLASAVVIIREPVAEARVVRRPPTMDWHCKGLAREPLMKCAKEHSAIFVSEPTKNVLLFVANTVAAVLFAFLAPVDWAAVVPLGIGCLIGSRLGPIVVRRAPSTLLRVLIGIAGMALAIRLGIQAYG